MNKITKRLPDSELELMMLIWESHEPVTSAYLMEKLEGTKDWGVTTVLNFLTRLVDRGFLQCTKQGRINVYSPIIDKKNYQRMESKSFLGRLHKNSLQSLMTSLYDGDDLTQADLDELQQFITMVSENTKEAMR